MHHLRFRQIHMDFHTSPHIDGIGAKFDKKQWQETLKKAAVNSVTTFATCHHGWSYYTTNVGQMHPHLKFDLLRAQFDASKEIDVNVPIYLTAGVNNMCAHDHPEWQYVDDQNKLAWRPNMLTAGFAKMCFNSPYLDFLCEQIREVTMLYPDCDGIFLDIISQGPCCCQYCMDGMLADGYEPDRLEDREAYARKVLLNYYKKTTEAAKHQDEAMPIFHNSGHIQRGETDILQYFSHLELESLPTGGWGYDHFPMSAKYVQKLPHDFLGMTGKFHTTWGEFGGFKHINALRYECAAMLAYGSKCSIGDQLHPCGKIDESTYELVGAAYREVAEKEAWCDNVENVAEVAVLSSVSVPGAHDREDPVDTGACRMLLEEHVAFDLIDTEMTLEPYKVVVLPDDFRMTDEVEAKLKKYLAGGGKLLAMGGSIIRDGKPVFDIGAEYGGESEFSPDFILPQAQYRPEHMSTPFVMYTRSHRIKITSGTSLGDVYDPYFNRSYKHFCSHQHTPYRMEPSGYACGVVNGNVTYLAHPLCLLYRGFGATNYRYYFGRVLNEMLAGKPMVETNMPSTARVAVQDQAGESRYVLHLLYANTISRGGAMNLSGGNLATSGRSIEVIEDLLPLNDVSVTLRLPKSVKSAKLVPQGTEIELGKAGGAITVKVDSFTCHQMVELAY